MLLERIAADFKLPLRVRKQLASFAFLSAFPTSSKLRPPGSRGYPK
jgi:hypothetical protein